MIVGFAGAVITMLGLRQGAVKVGASGTPLAVFDAVAALMVGIGVILIALHLIASVLG